MSSQELGLVLRAGIEDSGKCLMAMLEKEVSTKLSSLLGDF